MASFYIKKKKKLNSEAIYIIFNILSYKNIPMKLDLGNFILFFVVIFILQMSM